MKYILNRKMASIGRFIGLGEVGNSYVKDGVSSLSDRDKTRGEAHESNQEGELVGGVR